MIHHNLLIKGLLGIAALIVCAIIFCIGVHLNRPEVYFPCLIVACVVAAYLNYLHDQYLKQ